jgi:hypothetical protein
MSKSIYGGGRSGGGRSITQTIYGDVTNQCCTSIEPSVAPTQILQQLVAMIEKMKTAIEQFYPPSYAISQYTARLDFRVLVPFVVGVRLAWIKKYGTQTIVDIDGNVTEVSRKFDDTSEVDRLQLKDLYLAAGRDWRTDPMFIKLGLV